MVESRDEAIECRCGKRLISVIIPTYNCEKYIIKTIQSVVAQSYKNWEIILINDFSSDKSKSIIDKYLSDNPEIAKKIILIENPVNRGCYYSFNLGLQRCKGEYICILGSDDIYHRDKLKLQSEILDKNINFICVTGYYQRSTTLVKNMVMCTAMFRNEVIEDMGYFDSVRYAADSEFFRRIQLYYGKNRVHMIKKILYFAVKRSGSLTQSEKTKLRSKSRIEYWKTAKRWQDAIMKKKKKHKLYIPFPLPVRKWKAPSSML